VIGQHERDARAYMLPSRPNLSAIPFIASMQNAMCSSQVHP